MTAFPAYYYLLAFAVAASASLFTVPFWRRWALRTNLVDDPGHRKIHAQPVPLAGGFAVMTGLAVPILAGVLYLLWRRNGGGTANLLQYGFNERALELTAILLGALGMLCVGWLDDKMELSPKVKFGGQLLIATLVAAAGVRITLFVPSVLFSYAVTILWILTVTNAFNFIDNMNGLCAGVGGIAAIFFGLSSAMAGHYLVALLAFAIAGAVLGFLPFNYPKASVFLGDAGSHLVGFLAAVLAILPHFYSPEHGNQIAALKPLAVLAVPLADLVCVVILRWRIGQPFYIGDKNHFSHRLERRGISRAKSVALLWLAAVLFGSLALL